VSTLRVGDLELHYEEYGQGPPLLLLHGFFGAGVDWALFGDEWARDFRLIIPDLRGHGRSTNPSGQFTHRQCAADVRALCDALALDRFLAIGLSAGGNTLLHLATAVPSRVAAMVLVSATSHFPAEARALQRQFTFEALSPAERAALHARHAGGEPQLQQLLAQARGFADSYDDLAFTPDLLRTIRARTLVVQGDRDPLYPVEMAVALYRAIPSAALWILPDAGHLPVFGARDEFVRRARSFLTTTAA
jgi:pimeloyl-ACP methyl ester carboxylesterase